MDDAMVNSGPDQPDSSSELPMFALMPNVSGIVTATTTSTAAAKSNDTNNNHSAVTAQQANDTNNNKTKGLELRGGSAKPGDSTADLDEDTKHKLHHLYHVEGSPAHQHHQHQLMMLQQQDAAQQHHVHHQQQQQQHPMDKGIITSADNSSSLIVLQPSTQPMAGYSSVLTGFNHYATGK